MNIETLNYWLALGVIALQIAAAGLLASFLLGLLGKKSSSLEWGRSLLAKWGLWIGFDLAFIGSALTLFYSEILGFPPCPLCWWQRVLLYPQVVLFGLALWKRDPSISSGQVAHERRGDKHIADYSIALSILGLGVALYHHALQVLPAGSLPCPAEGVSCAQRFIFEFGYITFPLMAFSLFACLIILMLFVRRR